MRGMGVQGEVRAESDDQPVPEPRRGAASFAALVAGELVYPRHSLFKVSNTHFVWLDLMLVVGMTAV